MTDDLSDLAAKLQPILEEVEGTPAVRLACVMAAAALAVGGTDRESFEAACKGARAGLADYARKGRAAGPRPTLQ